MRGGCQDGKPWTSLESRRLLDAVVKLGRNWKSIKRKYFKSRTVAAIRNHWLRLDEGELQRTRILNDDVKAEGEHANNQAYK